MPLEALIFDVDGTLAETKDVHRRGFNAAFAGAGLDWRWNPEAYARLLQVTGGKERVRRYADELAGGPVLDEAAIRRLHAAACCTRRGTQACAWPSRRRPRRRTTVRC